MRWKARLPSCVDPKWYCIERGIRFVSDRDIRGCGGELYIPPPERRIQYRASSDPASVGLSIGHGISHDIIEVDLGGCPHSDVWRLNCEILIPADEVTEEGPEAFSARQPHAPRWLVFAWHDALLKGTVR
jgi:hypothetical protein